MINSSLLLQVLSFSARWHQKKFSSPNTQFVVCFNRLSSRRLLRRKPQNTKRRQAPKRTPTKKDVAKNKDKKDKKEREHRY
jgi:hypothetical protein